MVRVLAMCVGLLCLPAIALAEPQWIRELGTDHSVMSYVLSPDPNPTHEHRIFLSADSRGFTETRYVGRFGTPFGQYPGIGVRWSNASWRPVEVLLTVADHRQPFTNVRAFIDQRVAFAISDQIEFTFTNETYGRVMHAGNLYVGMSTAVAGVTRKWNRITWNYFLMFRREPLGSLRLSGGLFHHNQHAGQRWRGEYQGIASIRIEREWTRLR